MISYQLQLISKICKIKFLIFFSDISKINSSSFSSLIYSASFLNFKRGFNLWPVYQYDQLVTLTNSILPNITPSIDYTLRVVTQCDPTLSQKYVSGTDTCTGKKIF